MQTSAFSAVNNFCTSVFKYSKWAGSHAEHKNAPARQKGAEPCSSEPCAQGSMQFFHVLQKV